MTSMTTIYWMSDSTAQSTVQQILTQERSTDQLVAMVSGTAVSLTYCSRKMLTGEKPLQTPPLWIMSFQVDPHSDVMEIAEIVARLVSWCIVCVLSVCMCRYSCVYAKCAERMLSSFPFPFCSCPPTSRSPVHS
jgi:hypothetical protein